MNEQESFPSRLLRVSQTPLGAFCVGALALVASLANFLKHAAYPVFQPEIGLSVLFLSAIAALAALIYRYSGSLGRVALVMFLVIVALDLNFGVYYSLPVAIVSVLVLRSYTLAILGIMALVVLAGSSIELLGNRKHEFDPVVQDNSAGQPDRTGAPAIIHILLDGHIGPEGLDRKIASEANIAEAIEHFYAANGFRLFGGAYTVHRRTANSIPAIFNNMKNKLVGKTTGMTIKDNKYFDYLEDAGYRINVYQSDWINYCEGQAIIICKEWPTASPVTVISTSLSSYEKLNVINAQHFMLSRVLASISLFIDNNIIFRLRSNGIGVPPISMLEKSSSSMLAARQAIDEFIRDVGDARPGEAFFFHSLLSHYPFALDSECEAKSQSAWYVQSSIFVPLPERQHAYADQLRCTQKMLQLVLDALQSSPAANNNVVVIHSDHGSRITDVEPRAETTGQYSDQDVVTTHSALFAVRAKGVKADYITRRIPVHRLFAELLESDFTAVEGRLEPDYRHVIVIEDENWNPVESRDLPVEWINGAGERN